MTCMVSKLVFAWTMDTESANDRCVCHWVVQLLCLVVGGCVTVWSCVQML